MADPDEIRAEARKILEFFAEAEILVLKTHIAIHRALTYRIAQKRGVAVSSLRRITFLAAAKQVHGETLNRRLLRSLQILNDARNIVAHEEFTGEIFIKVAEIGRLCMGSGYNSNPATHDEADRQFREVLTFIEGWATIP